MLTLVSGPFHPYLEEAFIKKLVELKKDPLVPLAVVAPSARLMARLQLLVGGGHSFLNIHFHTFSSLAQHVVDEGGALDKPIFSDSLFFDTLVKVILKEKKPFGRLADLAVPEGFPPAVRATLRDLLDAGAPPEINEAVKEGFLGRDVDVGVLRELLHLYRLYMEKINSLPFSPRVELTKKATELAPESKYLAQFKEILYYGFYDLTGTQTDFFQAVTKSHLSTLYFPYMADHPDFVFAKRFRDDFVQRVLPQEIVLTEKEPEPVKDVKIMNVSGFYDEAWIVAKEILRAHHEEGIPFSEMAVVARNQLRIQEALPDLFEAWQIPFQSAAKKTLAQYPQVQLAIEYLSSQDWPAQDTWSSFSQKTVQALAEFTDWDLLKQQAATLSLFDHLSKSVKQEEFLETLRDRWMRTEFDDKPTSPVGVSLLYAEAARGLPFKIVFLIGLEERVFPRIIREDPFLRDDARLALSNTLGYKINQKMSAPEEERLLFHLITRAASKKLYFVYQRSDNEGKVVGASSFLRTFAEEQGIDLDKEVVSISRPYLEKMKGEKPAHLGKREILSWMLESGLEENAVSLAKKMGWDHSALTRGLQAQRTLDRFDNANEFDGLVGKQSSENIFPHGAVSPSALETFGRCPFQFFAKRVLELNPLEEPSSRWQLPPDEKGRLVHSFMENFFKEITENGKKKLPATLPEKEFESIFEKVVSKSSFPRKRESSALPASKDLDSRFRGNDGLHPLLWESLRLNIKNELHAYLKDQFPQLASENFTPKYFEQEWCGYLEPPLDKYKWTGTMDRIDVGESEVRVIDYKTGKIPKDPVKSALLGEKAQPPLYIIFAEKFLKEMGSTAKDISFSYHQLGEGHEVKELSQAEWQKYKPAIMKTIQSQIDQMHEGNFLINPSPEVCRYCEVEKICRKNHSISAYRAEHDEHNPRRNNPS